ncbi:MAG TPA: hypothetical protein DCQ77_13320 [Betaproteobacteria bacterium]|nr:hypothetical protein [Betaproteobacteria bacterium]
MAEAYEHGDVEGVSVCYCLLLDLIDLSLPSEIKLRIVGESAWLARQAQSTLNSLGVETGWRNVPDDRYPLLCRPSSRKALGAVEYRNRPVMRCKLDSSQVQHVASEFKLIPFVTK